MTVKDGIEVYNFRERIDWLVAILKKKGIITESDVLEVNNLEPIALQAEATEG